MNETGQSTEKRFSEAASENKKKRGRPTVYKRDHMEGIGRDLEIFDGRTHRTHVNQYYRAAVFGILEEHKEIPYLEEIFKIGQCLTERITPLRKKLKQAVQIYNKSPRLIDLLDKEYQIERKTYERTK